MCFRQLEREEQINLIDRTERSDVNVRYRVASIPPDTRVIITTNKHPREVFSIEYPEIRRRLQIIYVPAQNTYVFEECIPDGAGAE